MITRDKIQSFVSYMKPTVNQVNRCLEEFERTNKRIDMILLLLYRSMAHLHISKEIEKEINDILEDRDDEAVRLFPEDQSDENKIAETTMRCSMCDSPLTFHQEEYKIKISPCMTCFNKEIEKAIAIGYRDAALASQKEERKKQK